MVIKWTPELDATLFVKILETTTAPVLIDAEAIVNSWPTEYETPSRRAITEHLMKIRQTSKEQGRDANFSVSNSRSDKKNGGKKSALPAKKPDVSSPANIKPKARKYQPRNAEKDAMKKSMKHNLDPSDNNDDDEKGAPAKKPRVKPTDNVVNKAQENSSPNNDEKVVVVVDHEGEEII